MGLMADEPNEPLGVGADLETQPTLYPAPSV
jgi:hypothetical protein